MTMEAGADTQQSGETAVSESEAQQMTLAQVDLIITFNLHVAKQIAWLFSDKKNNCNCYEQSITLHTDSVWLWVAGIHSSSPGVLQ